MKKLLLACSLVVLTWGLAFAAGPRPQDTHIGEYSGGIPNQNIVLKATSGLIYDITLVATSANASVSIFDQASGTGSASNLAYEVQVATAGNTTSVTMNGAPMALDKGIIVSSTNGTAFLSYR